MKSELTIVTSLYDIGRGNLNNSFARSFDHYKESFSRLLKIKHLAMVIFCDPSLEQFIWEYRDRNNTKLIFKTEEDLKQFPFYSQVQKIRNNPNWYNQAGWLAESTQAKLPLYNPLVMSKQFFLNDATLFNFFDSNYFLWMDAGLANTVHLERYLDENFQKRIISKLNKMLYVCFPYDGKTEVHGFEKNKLNEYCGEESTYVARGGIFGGPKHLINELNAEYYNLLNETLNNGYMGTEESIFTILSYQHRNKCNLEFIEGNGLVYKFLEDLGKIPLEKVISERLAIYVLTFNLPKQFELWINSFKKAFPKEFNSCKKYLINNSTEKSVVSEYDKLISDNNFEEFKFDNIGINDGRYFAAEHFSKSNHDYYIFFEDDMLLCDKTFENQKCKNGLERWVPNLFNKSISILEFEKLDYLKLSFSEFYGDNHKNWAWFNVPEYKLKDLFPDKPKKVKGADAPKTLIKYTGSINQLPYACGEYHFCNWPLLMNKEGNKKVFFDNYIEHKHEATIMSQIFQETRAGKIKPGCLLASPINHDRVYHYEAKRKENKYYE